MPKQSSRADFTIEAFEKAIKNENIIYKEEDGIFYISKNNGDFVEVSVPETACVAVHIDRIDKALQSKK